MIYNYKYKIQELMGWNNKDFDKFFKKYERTLVAVDRKGVTRQIYNTRYIATVLTLFFFVYKHRIYKPKAFLMALILNGLIDDRFNLGPNHKQNHFLNDFFTGTLTNLIDEETEDHVKFLCSAQSFEIDDISKDFFDYSLFHDFRLAFRAITLEGKNTFLFYHLDPKQIFLHQSYSIDDPIVLEALLEVEEQILNLNMKDLFNQKIEAYKEFITT